MMRERVAGAGSSIVAPKPERNASSVRIVPSIQSEAISLIADIFTVLHRIRAGPSRPDRELVNAGLLRDRNRRRVDLGCGMSVGRARYQFFASLLIYDRLADCDVELAGEVVLGVALGDGVAEFFAHRAHVAPQALALGRGGQAHRGPQCREERAGDRCVEALPS